jgi:hypothetical protein
MAKFDCFSETKGKQMEEMVWKEDIGFLGRVLSTAERGADDE